MQDRFKFRVWDVKENIMLNWDCICQTAFNCTREEGNEIQRYGLMYFVFTTPQRFIPLQCTGLKDKNGKLIYEGDIVNVFFDTLKPHYVPLVVIWDRKEWQLAQLNKNYKKCENCANRNNSKCSYCKEFFMATGHTNFKDFYNGFVIGNIYTDKELLESEK